MEQLIAQLIAQQDLSFIQAEQFFNAVMQGQISEVQLTAALVALKIKQETPDEIAGAAQAMRANAVPFTTSLPLTADSCGTGGDAGGFGGAGDYRHDAG